jgi:hypothetical protein
MQTANCLVNIGGDPGNTVPKYAITATEIAVLRAIHGDDAVHDVEPAGSVQRSHREEIGFVKARYGNAKDPENNSIVETLFPGVASRAFENLAELELPEEFMKPTSRASLHVPPAPAAKPIVESALADMTVKELKAHAEQDGIDLGEASKKADIIAAIVAKPATVDEAEEDDGVGDLGDETSGLFE